MDLRGGEVVDRIGGIAAAVVLAAGVALTAACSGSTPSAHTAVSPQPSQVSDSRASPRVLAPTCRATALKAGTAEWVSPMTNVDMVGVHVRNTSNQTCSLRGAPRVIATEPGQPNVTAIAGGYALGASTRPVQLPPGATAALLFADSHGCSPTPSHRYHLLRIKAVGGWLSVRLPDRSRSSNPDLDGRRLALAVSQSCPPAVSGYLPGAELGTA